MNKKFELRCEICSQKFDSDYNIPKVLSCGHTVCSKCVERMKDKSLNKCPFDRKVLDFDDETIAINYYILSLIDNSVKDLQTMQLANDEEEVLELNPRPVINSPGWKNTMAGFIKNDILYTVETNGFIYCTDLTTGEWWFMYHNQFFGNFLFENPKDGKMYIIDQYGSLFQIFNKNYYVQIGKKNAWKNTLHQTVFNDKMYSIESSNKFYETNLQNGKWREIVISKTKQKELAYPNNFFSKSAGNFLDNPRNYLDDKEEVDLKLFKYISMLVSTPKYILFSNKNGELFSYNEPTGEARLITKDFNKNIEGYCQNSSHVYFFEKNSKIIYRCLIYINDVDYKKERSDSCASSMSELMEKLENDLKKAQENSDKSSSKDKITQKYPDKGLHINTNDECDNIYEKIHSNSKLKGFLEIEVFIDLETENILSSTNNTLIIPIKVITDDERMVIIDKIGDIYVFDLMTRKLKNTFQCLFMLRNCHLSNTALIGDGDLLLLDPIRLSLNKLNIIAGTEVIVLHSTKFLYTIKHIFSANSRIYFIDTSGNLYYFNEVDKKLTQIGNNSICKYIVDFAVHKSFLLTIENNTLYRTNLNDGNYVEVKNEFCKNYEFFFGDNANIIFINKDDEINVTMLNINTPTNKDSDLNLNKDGLKLKKSLKYPNISKMSAVTYFRNHIIFYNKDQKTIEMINIEDNTHKKMIENFPDVNMFICNNDFLACISRDGVIYKLYC